jgi:DNA/RNA-binding domain of Phe-tRNA-synthetase-like protein
MHFCHSAQVWAQYPQLVPGLLLVEGITPEVALGDRLEPFFRQARAQLQASNEGQMPPVMAWRRAYSQMGLKPTQYRSAAESLLRRFRKEDTLPALHPLVDVCNAVSLAYALPVAVFDLAGVDGFLEVRHATGAETYLSFSEEIEHPAPQEIIFADARHNVHARRWTFRQSRQSTVSMETRRVLIVSEGLHDTAPTDVPRLIDTLAGQITELWSAPRQRAILTAAHPRLEIAE